MADKNMPNSSSNRDKAEGERWSSEQESVRNSERDSSSPERSGSSSERSSGDRNSYSSGNRDESSGGISNRPLGEEIENQESLPQRGTSQSEERPRRNEDVER